MKFISEEKEDLFISDFTGLVNKFSPDSFESTVYCNGVEDGIYKGIEFVEKELELLINKYKDVCENKLDKFIELITSGIPQEYFGNLINE